MSVFVNSLSEVQDTTLSMNQIAVGTSSMNRETVLQYLKGTVGFV